MPIGQHFKTLRDTALQSLSACDKLTNVASVGTGNRIIHGLPMLYKPSQCHQQTPSHWLADSNLFPGIPATIALMGTVTTVVQQASWWLNRPFEKYARQIGSSPQVREKIINLWNHHQASDLSYQKESTTVLMVAESQGVHGMSRRTSGVFMACPDVLPATSILTCASSQHFKHLY